MPATSRARDAASEAEAGAPLRVRLAPHVPRGPCCRRLGARLLPAPAAPLSASPALRRPRQRRRRRRMAELRFCLAEPLQLVARRNEKSSAELSRFLAKQVSERRGSRPPSPWGASRSVPRGGKRTRFTAFPPPRRHLLPAALSAARPARRPLPPPRTGAARREQTLRSLSVRPSYGSFPSSPLSGLCEWSPAGWVLSCPLVLLLLRFLRRHFAPWLKFSVSSLSLKVALKTR